MMIDGDPDFSDILEGMLNGIDDEELVFDEPATTPPSAGPQPAAPEVAKAAANDGVEETPTKPRRAPRRGRKDAGSTPAEPSVAETAPSPGPDMAELEALAMQVTAEAAPTAAAAEPAGAPAPLPPRGVEPAGSTPPPSKLLLAIVALALFTSLLSVGGLIAVGRTLAHAEADRRAAAADRQLLARIPALVARLDQASRRADGASARLAAASPSGPPVSIADLHHELDSLRVALAARQPDGLGALNGLTRDGLSEIGQRLDLIQARLDGRAPARPRRDPASDEQ